MIVKVPLFVKVGTSKKVYLNMNTYRNLHYFTSNLLKKEVKRIVQSQVIGEIDWPCVVEIVLIVPDKRRRDLSNFCSVADKMVCDALVEIGAIPDDSTDYIKEVRYLFGGIDKVNSGFLIRVSKKD